MEGEPEGRQDEAAAPSAAASVASGAADVRRSGPLRARFDLELDPLATHEAVEIERGIEAAAMEEVLLLILGADEAEAAIGDDLLDGTGGHSDLQHFSNLKGRSHGPFEKGSTTRSIVAHRGEIRV
jgi:hypothetical protein